MPQVVGKCSLSCIPLNYDVHVIMLKVMGQSARGVSSEATPAGPSTSLQKR